MPRERQEIFRESKSKPKEKIFVLAYEGNNTEALYFEALREDTLFNDELIHLYSLRRPKGDTKSAPKHVFTKLKKEVKEEYQLENTDELWMIIDTDQWTDIHTINTLCKQEGNFYLAVSNPCFELWLLLHIKDISDFKVSTQNKIFENKKEKGKRKKTYLKRLLNTLIAGGYHDSDPLPNRFLPNIKAAIERARDLDDLTEDFPTKLGTHVYKLAERIIK